MSSDKLIIIGANQNNLKNISLELPHNQVIAVTGVSGSGKSSLAFDTIFAEGQWRFIESLSTYARLFLEKLDRPKVESIENIRAAIALEQKNPVRTGRSTVGTLTELYDYFRLMFAKASTPFCPVCGREVRRWEPTLVAEELIDNHDGAKAHIIFTSELDTGELKKQGFLRVYIDGRAVALADIDDDAVNQKKGSVTQKKGSVSQKKGSVTPHGPPFEVVLDRLVIRDEARFADSVEGAMREGHGRVRVAIVDGPDISYARTNTCEDCHIELPEPTPVLFSFNHPVGACETCKGFGNVLGYDESLVVPDPHLSLKEGAIGPWEKPAARWWRRQLMKWAKKEKIDTSVPWMLLPEDARKAIFKGDEGFYGVDEFFEELEGKRYKLHVRVFLSRYRKASICPDCGGKRLSPEVLAYKIGGLDIADMTNMGIGELEVFFKDIDLPLMARATVTEVLKQIEIKLRFLNRVGLDYLSLDREGKTLSGGEYQRVNLSNQLASGLTGTLCVLDEPTVGLHMRDTDRITGIMSELAEVGNTIVVVEHDLDVISSSDWVVELGPGGGHLGGNVVYSGPIDGFWEADTITSRSLNEPSSGLVVPRKPKKGNGTIKLTGARGHNLKNVKVEIPLEALSVVTGVSGSGKSSLIVDTLFPALQHELRMASGVDPLEFKTLSGHENIKAIKLIDQSPIGKSPRSNPVTYLKIFDAIRKLFAGEHASKAHGYLPGFFSFNVPGGRCETCKGEGYQKMEMYFFEDLYITCEDCGGTRYGHEVLSIQYRGKRIDEVLEMTVDEAMAHFGHVSPIRTKLSLMGDVGLGYLRLGQPATTLSGGEAQRLKLCAELGSLKLTSVLYLLDEPTVGLHATDVSDLMRVINRLVDAGNTVLIIEHNPDVILMADHVIDLGPEGGDGGGEVVFTGPPEKLLRSRKSITGKYLKNIGKSLVGV
ncbi:MAG: excinuclease ABC subunit UvrA [Thermodesulfovibrionales bacterium]|nr:excinuclease ABC subunit UvrA [Thermodesulfovibrionales bacterium]